MRACGFRRWNIGGIVKRWNVRWIFVDLPLKAKYHPIQIIWISANERGLQFQKVRTIVVAMNQRHIESQRSIEFQRCNQRRVQSHVRNENYVAIIVRQNPIDQLARVSNNERFISENLLPMWQVSQKLIRFRLGKWSTMVYQSAFATGMTKRFYSRRLFHPRGIFLSKWKHLKDVLKSRVFSLHSFRIILSGDRQNRVGELFPTDSTPLCSSIFCGTLRLLLSCDIF